MGDAWAYGRAWSSWVGSHIEPLSQPPPSASTGSDESTLLAAPRNRFDQTAIVYKALFDQSLDWSNDQKLSVRMTGVLKGVLFYTGLSSD